MRWISLSSIRLDNIPNTKIYVIYTFATHTSNTIVMHLFHEILQNGARGFNKFSIIELYNSALAFNEIINSA